MSRATEAAKRLRDANERTFGKRLRVLIGRKYYDALWITPLALTDIFGVGGQSQSGSFKAGFLMSDFAKEPKKFTPIQTKGTKELQILDVTPVNGTTYEITAGDVTAESA